MRGCATGASRDGAWSLERRRGEDEWKKKPEMRSAGPERRSSASANANAGFASSQVRGFAWRSSDGCHECFTFILPRYYSPSASPPVRQSALYIIPLPRSSLHTPSRFSLSLHISHSQRVTMPGPVAVGNGGIQGGKKSAITGILMTSFAAFGTSFSPTLLIVVSTQSLTLVFP